MNCETCGAELTVDTQHRFDDPDSKTVARYCDACCPRCFQQPTDKKGYSVP